MFISCYCAPLIISGIFLILPLAVVSDEDVNESWNITTMDRLRVQLFTNYDKTAHPMISATERTKVTVGMTISYIDIDELEGKMTIHAWISLNWKDGGRSWNPEYFENITTLHVRAKEVWKPDITLFNSAGRDGDYVGDTQTLLYNDGSFLWVPPVVYTAYCNLNLRMWPYDTQKCKLKLGTWTLTKIDIYGRLSYEDSLKSPEWEVVDSRSEAKSEEFYNYIEYTFELKRCSSMYSAVIFTPASCIIILCLSIFWLPPQMGEKILLNAVVIVIVAAFLMYFAQMLPILAENTPLIVLFYSASLLLLSLSTITSVVVLYLATSKHKQRVPEIFKKLLNGTLGNVILLSQFTLEAEPNSLLNNCTKEMDDHVYENPDQEGGTATDQTIFTSAASPSNRSVQFDWILLATAVDRICFCAFSIAFITLAIVYSI